MHVLVTRPEPDGAALKVRLEAHGHRVTLEPLIRIEFCPVEIGVDGVQALIATSRNALRALAAAPALAEALRLPIFTVGPATSAVADKMGFECVHQGPGDARGLMGLIGATVDPRGGALLHLAGDTLAFDIAQPLATKNYDVRQAIVYRSIAALAFTVATRDAFATGHLDAVILMSRRASKVYARLVEQAGLGAAAGRVVHFCLSRSVAQPLAGLARIEVAREANSEDMLALVNRTAKTPV